MSEELIENTEETVRLQRPPPRVFTDSIGRNVWMGDIEVVNLELVQTTGSDPYNTVETRDPWSGV